MDLVYALVQVLHNAGAVAVVGGPAAALGACRPGSLERHRLAWLLLVAWSVQAVSGAGFAAASYGFKGALPEVEGVALAALVVKIAATVIGGALALALVARGRGWSARRQNGAWTVALVLAGSALTAAAFLRWYL